MECAEGGFSPHPADFDRLFVFRPDLRGVYERLRLFFLVPNGDEPDHLRRVPGICGGFHADGRLRASSDTDNDADDPGKAFVLRHLHAGKI